MENCLIHILLLVYYNLFQFVKDSGYVNNSWIHSWNQPVLSIIQIQLLPQWNKEKLWWDVNLGFNIWIQNAVSTDFLQSSMRCEKSNCGRS